MEKLKSFIKRQPSYVLVVVGLVLLGITFSSPRYVGIIPGVLAMATWVVVLGRAVGKSAEKHADIKRPWWTNL